MKSKTSFFNRAVLKKNITRFAPVWALYSAFLLMALVVMATENTSYYFASNVADFTTLCAVVNFLYAPLCALLLFGDLYNSRMCNALHAMPIRREGWFLTNVVSGLLFELIPNTVFALISLPLMGDLLAVPFLWVLATTLQYLFFFGAAVLATYCVGNRFAMGLIYIIINGFSLILYGLVEMMYSPLMYGVIIREEIFYVFAPLVNMVSNSHYVYVEKQGAYAFPRWYLGEGWGYLVICAVIGLVFLVIGLAAYRRRNLECAGDFIAIRKLSPVFLVLYTLCGGACCCAFFSLFMGEESYFFLLLGFVIGFFTGKMLLERTVKVFRSKTFLGFGAFMLAFLLSFIAIKVDLFSIARWVPNVNRIASVTLSSNALLELDDPADIEDVLMIHRHGLENRMEGSDGRPDVHLTISYHMKDGSIRNRKYYINHDTEAGIRLKAFLSSPEAVLGEIYTKGYRIERAEVPDMDLTLKDPQEIQSLLSAVLEDCEESNLGQNWNYTNHAHYQFWLELEYGTDLFTFYRTVRVSSDAEHVVAWFTEHYGDFWQQFEKMNYGQ